MSKSTVFEKRTNEEYEAILSPGEFNKLPKSPSKKTIDTILAFSRSYSVRKGKHIEKMEFNLN